MSVSGLILLLIAAALILAETQHGTGGAAAWLRAKFLGETVSA